MKTGISGLPDARNIDKASIMQDLNRIEAEADKDLSNFMDQMTFTRLSSTCSHSTCSDLDCSSPSRRPLEPAQAFPRRGNFFASLFQPRDRCLDNDNGLGLRLLEMGEGESTPRSTISTLTASFDLSMVGRPSELRRRYAVLFICLCAFGLFAWLIAIVAGGGGVVEGGGIVTVSVATWNVLCIDDEYSDQWGCPLQIQLCGDGVEGREACTEARRRREWGVIEGLQVDAMAVQEMEVSGSELWSAKL